MAEPYVPFALRLPVDLDAAIRAEAKRTNRSIQATIIEWLRHAEQVKS